jgi:hypothetical protein
MEAGMDQERRISWDHYETYRRCPQWFSWAFLTPKQVSNAFKDSQHLIRGNATQLVVDRWASEKMWLSEDPHALKRFMDHQVHKAVIESWVEDQHIGRPRCRPIDLTQEIRENLERDLPLLQAHMREKSGGLPREVIAQTEVEYKWQDKVYLFARLDLLVLAQDYRRMIYEGNPTKKPENTKEDQLRWQAEILFNSQILQQDEKNHRVSLSGPPSKHYFLFYHTGEIKEITTHRIEESERGFQLNAVEEHWVWMKERDSYLDRMLDADLKATPNRIDCHICNFRPICPDRYKPKKRNAETAMEPPKKGNQINIL